MMNTWKVMILSSTILLLVSGCSMQSPWQAQHTEAELACLDRGNRLEQHEKNGKNITLCVTGTGADKIGCEIDTWYTTGCRLPDPAKPARAEQIDDEWPTLTPAYISGMSDSEVSEHTLPDIPALTGYVYLNTGDQIKIRLPFNPAWGGTGYQVNPYDRINESTIAFGPVVAYGTGKSRKRKYTMTVLPHLPAEEQVDDIIEREDAIFTHAPRLVPVAGKRVIGYVTSGSCAQAESIIMGVDYNYLFSPNGCHDAYRDDLNVYGDIAGTMSAVGIELPAKKEVSE